MKLLKFAAITAGALFGSMSLAQAVSPTGATGANSNMQMSQSDCTSLWQQANSGNASGLTESQAGAYVTDFKAANPDGDSTIDQSEWMAACSKGLVKNSSSSGSSTGMSGSGSGKTSDRTPGNPAPARTPNASSTGASGTEAGHTPEGTSDRTPGKNDRKSSD